MQVTPGGCSPGASAPVRADLHDPAVCTSFCGYLHGDLIGRSLQAVADMVAMEELSAATPARDLAPRARARASEAAGATGLLATAAFVVAPAGSVVQAVFWATPFVLAVVLLAMRTVSAPAAVQGPLRLLVAGAAVYLGASFVWYLGPVHLGQVLPFPSLLDVAFFAAYGLYAAFLLAMLRRRSRDTRLENRLAVTDATIFTLALSTVLWGTVAEPNLDNGTPALSTAVTLLYPGAQLLLFALAIRLLSLPAGRGHRRVLMLLLVWLGGELLGDVLYGVQSVNGTFRYDGPLTPMWMVAYTGLAAFAVHPAMPGFIRAADVGDAASGGAGSGLPPSVIRRLRVALLLLASWVPLTLAALTTGDDLVLMAVAAVVFGLVLYRASLLAGDLNEQRQLAADLDAAAARLRTQHGELARLAAAVDASGDAIITSSPQGLVLDWNPAAARLYGYTRAEAVGQHVEALLPADGPPGTVLNRIEEDGHHHLERVISRKDGSAVEVEATLSTIGDDDGRLLGFVGISRDVGERNALQRELADRARRLDEAQKLAGVGSFERDLATGRDVWSSEYYRLLGVEEGTEATYALYLDRLHPDDRPWVEQQIATHDPSEPLEYEARILRPDGELRWIAVRGALETDAEGVPVRETGTAHDITARKAAEEELERLAQTDTLTGLANRDRFTAILQSALDDAAGQRAVGLLLLDLDGFKDVNDGIGHHAGDLVLQEVARRIRAVLRSGDEAARLGGDEFAFVLPRIGDVGQAIKVATTVRACLEPPFDLDGLVVRVGGSIGIAVSDERTSPGSLLKKADVAMYRAKTLSSGWAVFEPDQDDLAAGRLQMVTDLRAMIERGDLDVVYQPILETSSRQISSFEALARWQHPEKGLIPPDQFIPLAEQADLIGPLTRLVLRKATAACVAWRSVGHDLRIGVNVSVQVLHSGDPCRMVNEVLAETGLDPQHLVLEITESSLATEGEQLDTVLRALRALGVTLVIDDFGTGYSAMSYLKQLPVEELKIDRSFVRDVVSDTRDLAIVRSLVRLAHSLSLRVVAEGVESVAALEVLTELGCDFAQGYGIARPMPEGETAGWLAGYRAPAAARVPDDEPTRLLIVDDDEVVRVWLTALAERDGWQVRTATSAEEALADVEQWFPDVVILDHHMTGMTGAESVPQLRARGVDGPILLFTNFLNAALPSLRVPLDVWPVAKSNADGVFQLLQGYRTSARASTSPP